MKTRYCAICLITLPTHEIAPTENKKPTRSFLAADILSFHSTISGTDRRAKSKVMWIMLREMPTAFLFIHSGAAGREPYVIRSNCDNAGTQVKILRKSAVIM